MSWRYKNLGESMLSAIWALSDIQRDTRQILREDPDADTRLLSTLLLEAEHLSAALETLFPPTLLERIWQEQKKENA